MAFFPLAFTSVCTDEMGCFTEASALFEGVDAKVFGISVDSVPALKEFKAKNGFGVDLLSDFKRDVCRAYGTLIVRWSSSRPSWETAATTPSCSVSYASLPEVG